MHHLNAPRGCDERGERIHSEELGESINTSGLPGLHNKTSPMLLD